MRASRSVIPIALAVVAFLAGLQVIVTEAESDQEMLQAISAKVAGLSSQTDSSAGAGIAVTSPVPLIEPQEGATQSGPLDPLEPLAREVPALPPVATDALAPQPVPEAVTPAEATRAADDAEAGETQAAGPTLDSSCLPSPGGEPFCIYTVQEGDTLSTIAENLGLTSNESFSGGELLAMSNQINDAQNWLIVPGQELRVPVQTGVIHTVGVAQSMSLLAEMYGVTTADVIAANALADVDVVPVGSTLLIPSPSLWPVSGPAPSAAAEDEAGSELTAEAEAEAAGDEGVVTETADAGAEDVDEVQAESSEEQAQARELPPAPANANPSLVQIRDRFSEGYIAAGGPPEYLEHILVRVIPCESGYNVRAYNPAGPFYGLMQFLAETWARSGGGDWFDPWQQGANTARLLQASNPLTQWPHCWR